MKIPSKQELQQTVFNYSPNIDFQNFMNLYKKCTEKPFSIFMSIDDKIGNEKLPYDINREVAKLSALSSGKY